MYLLLQFSQGVNAVDQLVSDLYLSLFYVLFLSPSHFTVIFCPAASPLLVYSTLVKLLVFFMEFLKKK